MDFVETAPITGERPGLTFHGVEAEVLEEIVVGVDAVKRGVRGMRFVKISEQIVDEVRERFGSYHVSG